MSTTEMLLTKTFLRSSNVLRSSGLHIRQSAVNFSFNRTSFLSRRNISNIGIQNGPFSPFKAYVGLPKKNKSVSCVKTTTQARNLFIQTESTPNVDSLKFKPGMPVMSGSSTIEFHSYRDATPSPLAKQLFKIPGVQSVFYGPDFITVSKEPDANWKYLKPDIYGAITDHFTSNQPLLTEDNAPKDTQISDEDSETVVMIKELLDSRIRPTIQEDGGDIEYVGFEDGTVKLKLKGACRTCDSSVVTLKNGIENMLKFYIEDVKSVEQVLEEHEKISNDEFDKLEKSLEMDSNSGNVKLRN